MRTEQVLIAMIQNPGKKFTDGRRTASFVNDGATVYVGCPPLHCTVFGFLNGFPDSTWTEHKEPRTFKEEVKIEFAPAGGSVIEPVLSIPDIVRLHVGPINGSKWRAEIKVTEVL